MATGEREDIGLEGKTTTLHVHHTQLRRENSLFFNFYFYGGHRY